MPIPQIKLDEAQQKKLVAELKEMESAAEEFHSTWEELHKIYWQQYFCQPDSEVKNYPWRNASNLFLPLGRVIQDGIQSQLHDAILSNDPPVKVSALRGSSMQRSDILSLFYGKHVCKKVIPFKKFGNDWNFLALTDGTGIARNRWDRTRILKRTVEVSMEPVYGEAQQMDMSAMMGMPNPPPVLAVQESVNEYVEIVREEKPILEVMDGSRLFIAPDTVNSLQYPDCKWYYIVKDLTWGELQIRKREGYANVDEELAARMGKRSPEEIERLRRENAAVSEGTVLNTTEVKEFYMRLVLPAEYLDGETKKQSFMEEGGYEEEVIVTYFPATEKIARIVPLQRVSPRGRRPDIALHYAGGIPFRFYGQGIQAKMRHLNAALNTSSNQMMDYGTLQNLPFYFYTPHMAQLPDLTGLAPGQGVPVADPRGVLFPRFNTDPNFFMMYNQFIQGYAERDGKITDQNTGRMPERAANKTFRGMALAQQMQNVAFKQVASLMADSYLEAMYDIHALYRRYAPPEIVFRVTDERGADFEEMRITRDEIDHDVELEMVINPDRSNDVQVAEKLFQLIVSIPYVAQNPKAVRASAKQLYNAIGHASGVRNFEEIWPEEMTYQIMQAQQQQQMQAGIPPTPPPQGGMGQPQIAPPTPEIIKEEDSGDIMGIKL